METPTPRSAARSLFVAPAAAALRRDGRRFRALYQLASGHDPQELPSALIGNPAPPTNLPPVEGTPRPTARPVPGLDLAAGDGRPTLVNVFASWCVPCRQEHPMLMDLAEDPRIAVVGINYKDKPKNAPAFLDDLGNPYARDRHRSRARRHRLGRLRRAGDVPRRTPTARSSTSMSALLTRRA